MRKTLKPALFALMAMMGIAAGTAGEQLAVIELKHRPAEEVIPVLEPFLQPGDTLSGHQFTLFLTAGPENLARLQAIVSTIDKAPRQLMITVVQGAEAKAALASLDASGNVSAGEVRIESGRNPQPKDTVAITAGDRDSGRNELDVQKVRTREGTAAVITIGQSVPVTLEKGAPPNGTITYREVLAGFRIIPRLSGDRFVLEIESRRESLHATENHAIAVQQVQTQINGRLNEWIDIGAVVRARRQRRAGIAYGESGEIEEHRQVFLKMVEVR